MKVYQIFFPELSTYVKFKILDPEKIEEFLSRFSRIETQIDFEKFKKAIIENFIFNLKSDISDSLRMMSRTAAEKCINALYTRMHNAKSRTRFKWMD